MKVLNICVNDLSCSALFLTPYSQMPLDKPYLKLRLKIVLANKKCNDEISLPLKEYSLGNEIFMLNIKRQRSSYGRTNKENRYKVE